MADDLLRSRDSSVWVVEYGDYEQRSIEGVFASVATAVEAIKRPYGPPYVVRWDEPEQRTDWADREMWILRGHFEAVLHYSTQHTAEYGITRYEVTSDSSPLDAQCLSEVSSEPKSP